MMSSEICTATFELALLAPLYSSSQQLLNLIQWSWMDPWFSLRVIAQLNALPLAVQITNIVGGVAVC